MQGNIINMVQKNLETLKTQVRNVIKKSTLESLPSIHRHSGSFNTIQNNHRSLNPKKNRQSASKQFRQLNIQSSRRKSVSLTYKEEFEAPEYKVILMNPRKMNHPKKIMTGKYINLSTTIEHRPDLETIQNILTAKQEKREDKEQRKKENPLQVTPNEENGKKKIFKRTKKQLIPKQSPEIYRRRKQQNKIAKLVKTDNRPDENILHPHQYTPWESSLQQDEMPQILINNGRY